MCQYFNEPSGRKAAFGVFVCCALQAPAAFAEGNSLTFSVDSSASALADDANYVQFYQGQSDAVTATKFVNTWAGGGFYNRSSAISDSKSDQHTTLSGQINTIVDTALGATVAASSATTTIDVVGLRNTVFGTQLGDGGDADIDSAGNDNAVTLYQVGDSAVAVLDQLGDANTLVIGQIGAMATGIRAVQTGDNNGIFAFLNATTGRGQANITQTGDENIASITAVAENATLDAVQTGNINTAIITVMGNDAVVDLAQTSDGAYSHLYIEGNENRADVTGSVAQIG